MLSYIKKSVLFFFLLLLCSCSSTTSLYAYDRDKFISESKSVVFFYVSVENSPDSVEIVNLRTGAKYYKSFVEDSENSMFSMFGGAKKNTDLTVKHMMLDPGMYYINGIQLVAYSNEKNYFQYSPGIRDDLILLGLFEVKPGEILSLGQIDISSEKLNYNNNIASLRQQLGDTEDMSDLAYKVKLGRLYKNGSLLLRDKNSNVRKIISPEIVEAERQLILKQLSK